MSHLAKAWFLHPAGGWVKDAACVGVGPELFFDEVTPETKALCAACPVQRECLDYAISNDEQHGFWGGMSTRDRRWEKKQRRVA